MKKIITLFLCALIFTFALCSCGGDKLLGKMSKTSYTNSTLNIKIDLPENWQFANDATRLSMMGLAPSEYSSKEEQNKVIRTLGLIYPALMSNTNTGSTVAVQLTREGGQNGLDDYADEFLAYLKNDGSVYSKIERSYIEFTGHDAVLIETIFDLDGTPFSMNYYIYDVEYENTIYHVSIIVTKGTGEYLSIEEVAGIVKKAK
ncbi:MAG: hypothetical protein J5922_01455 [Clostridia bacterium]|nr:hypothetical protein [Clostridia bacterium]